MEQAPQSPEKINAQIAQLEQEIIDLEGRLNRTHDDTGSNSIEDNSQEETMDLQKRDIIASQIASRRDEISRLRGLLH